MNVQDAIKYAGYLMQVIEALRGLAETDGISREEFERRARAECQRITDWEQLIRGMVDGNG